MRRGILKHVGKKLKEALDRMGMDGNVMLEFISNNIVTDVEGIHLAQEQGEVAGAAGKLLLSQCRLQPLS